MMKNAVLVLMLGLFSFGQAHAQSSKEKVVIKTTAVCEMCKRNIEKAVYEVEGVKSVYLDVESQLATVKFDGAVTNADAIRQAISKAGYDADEVPANEEAYGKLNSCCRQDSVH